SLSYLIPRPPLPPPFPTRRSSDLHALDVTQRQGQRRHEAQRIRPRRIEQQTCLERLRRDLSSERLAERQRQQQAAAAHLAEPVRSEEHTSELQSLTNLVCRLLLEK